jgi:multiple sugar transport system ATP-binding protein
MGSISLENVSKSFDDVQVIPGADLEITDGEFVVFVGPSGCGKSTLLRLIAGLEDISGGVLRIDGNDATSIPPAKRGLAMVFQSYALYPHMSVYKNIAFPLKMAKMDQAAIDKKVREAAKAAPLTAFIASYSSPEGLFFAKLSAASTMAIAPILIIGWFSQKQLVRGLTFGAVK